jgi:uncharacterized membrane protein YccC
MANVKEASKVSLKDKIRVSFNAPGIQTECPCSKFQFDSTMFRHSLRLTIAIVFAYLLGFLDIQNTYWILLTVIVMRPSYGLTKERSKDRIIGTPIGAAVGGCAAYSKCSLCGIGICFIGIRICIDSAELKH